MKFLENGFHWILDIIFISLHLNRFKKSKLKSMQIMFCDDNRLKRKENNQMESLNIVKK